MDLPLNSACLMPLIAPSGLEIITGTAMGTPMVSQYANIFMVDLEHCLLNSYPLAPFLYLRFIDDIFIIWTYGKEILEKFTRLLTTSMPASV